MKTTLNFILSLLFAILLGACATSYEPIGQSGGFYQRRETENTYYIGFSGNSFTNSQRVNDFAILRAAEIGSKLGYTHFVVEGTLDRSSTEIVDMGTTTTTSGRVNENRHSTSFQSTSTTTNNAYKVYKPGVEIKVVYSEGPPKGRHLDVYVVREVIRDIKARYDINP
jgi:hypothetical protein